METVIQQRATLMTYSPGSKCLVATRRSPNSRGNRDGNNGFTLLELLVVIGIISVLLVAIVPAVNSLSKSSGRKAAISNLLGAIEQARAQAIKDGQAAYIVFPDQLPGSPDAVTIQRYSYRSYAIFEDDAANPGSVKQLAPWRTLPTGVSLRKGSLNYLAKTTVPFTPGTQGNSAPPSTPFPSLKFNAQGEVDPSSTPTATTGTIQFGVFEGQVDNGTERDTTRSRLTDSIAVNRLTGRAERM